MFVTPSRRNYGTDLAEITEPGYKYTKATFYPKKKPRD